jgi:hypothetical protein
VSIAQRATLSRDLSFGSAAMRDFQAARLPAPPSLPAPLCPGVRLDGASVPHPKSSPTRRRVRQTVQVLRAAKKASMSPWVRRLAKCPGFAEMPRSLPIPRQRRLPKVVRLSYVSSRHSLLGALLHSIARHDNLDLSLANDVHHLVPSTAKSTRLRPRASSSTNHLGLRPRPDQAAPVAG